MQSAKPNRKHRRSLEPLSRVTPQFMSPRRRFVGPGLLIAALALAVGCGGGNSSTGSTGITTLTPSVKLTANPTSVAAGDSAILTWTSSNVSSVQSSTFGASAISGHVTVGPLSETTSYSITCTGPNGSATGRATISVTNVTSIPTGVLLYSIQNASGTSTLFYQRAIGGNPVTVGTYSAGVTVLGTNATGTRLILAEPVGGTSTNQKVVITDLDGMSHPVSDASFTTTQVNDACFSASGDLIVAHANGLYYISPSGAGLTGFGGIPSQSCSVSPDGLTSAYCLTNRIEEGSVPSNASHSTLVDNGAYSWVRFSADGSKLTFVDSNAIYTINADGSNRRQIDATGTHPTFDNSGSTVYFSRARDGIYSVNLATGSESKLASIAGTWDGRILWH